MSGFDRSKFRSSSASDMAAKQADINQKRPGQGERAGYFKIENGDNIFRIAPFHPDGGGNLFYEFKTVSWLSVEMEKKDDAGNVLGKEIRQKSIFNSKVHGNVDLDLVESYIDIAKKDIIPAYVTAIKGGPAHFSAVWEKIVGKKDSQSKKGDKYQPIKPSDSVAMYASKGTKNADGTIKWSDWGILEVKKTIKEAMNKLAAECNEIDPFSDPEEGIPVVITKNPNAKIPADWYSTTLLKTRTKDGFIFDKAPLSDAQLTSLLNLQPLYKTFVNSFKHKDLKYQLEGLQRLDNNLINDHPGFPGVFSSETYLDMVGYMFEAVPETADDAPGAETSNVENYHEEEPEPAAAPAPTTRLAPRATPAAKPAVQITPAVVTPPPAETKVEVAGEDPAAKLLAMRKKLGLKV
jgi:hypothetical protein